MGGPKVHILSDVDGDHGTCAHCGPVEVLWRNQAGTRRPACAVARRAEHQTPGCTPRVPWGSYVKPGGHGLTVAEARARVADGTCEGCGSTEKLTNDHDHATEALRGILCNSCNRALGLVRDSPTILRALAEYVERHAQP